MVLQYNYVIIKFEYVRYILLTLCIDYPYHLSILMMLYFFTSDKFKLFNLLIIALPCSFRGECPNSVIKSLSMFYTFYWYYVPLINNVTLNIYTNRKWAVDVLIETHKYMCHDTIKRFEKCKYQLNLSKLPNRIIYFMIKKHTKTKNGSAVVMDFNFKYKFGIYFWIWWDNFIGNWYNSLWMNMNTLKQYSHQKI